MIMNEAMSSVINNAKTRDLNPEDEDVIKFLQASTQNSPCLSDNHSLEAYNQNPDRAEKLNEIWKNPKDDYLLIPGSYPPAYTYKPQWTSQRCLKLVFHSFSTNFTQSDAQSCLDWMNAKFDGSSGTAQHTEFAQLVGNNNIKCVLHDFYNHSWNPAWGSSQQYTGGHRPYDKVREAMGYPSGQNYVDPDYYINVIFLPLPSGFGGWATLGGVTWGSQGGGTYECTFNSSLPMGVEMKNIVAHEMGHFFGLAHTWGSTPGGQWATSHNC